MGYKAAKKEYFSASWSQMEGWVINNGHHDDDNYMLLNSHTHTHTHTETAELVGGLTHCCSYPMLLYLLRANSDLFLHAWKKEKGVIFFFDSSNHSLLLKTVCICWLLILHLSKFSLTASKESLLVFNTSWRLSVKKLSPDDIRAILTPNEVPLEPETQRTL